MLLKLHEAQSTVNSVKNAPCIELIYNNVNLNLLIMFKNQLTIFIFYFCILNVF